ncbi:replication initiator protein RepA [Salmonella enterica subsp. enterica serovar Telelkebir]|nr:replication initiator protein RepA [Salmonella enterica subsp. enterica serovar Telelkebir]
MRVLVTNQNLFYQSSESNFASYSEYKDFTPVSPKKSKRRRGDHSTACKCPAPGYVRPEKFSQLPGVLRKCYHRALKRRLSRHPYFVQMRELAGRQRGFRPERQSLLDAIGPLLFSACDIATFTVTLNSAQMRKALSKKDAKGDVIESEAVTDSRICRMLDEMVRYGLIEPYIKQIDPYTKSYLPRHVTLTLQCFKLVKADMEALRLEQEKRLKALSEGVLAPGETLSVKVARQRFLEEKTIQALKVRRARAAEQKRLRNIARTDDLDDRQYQIAAWLIKTRPETAGMSPDDFELLVFSYLRQIKLNYDTDSPA